VAAGDSQVDADERRSDDDDHHGAPPRGARQLTAILPNGRTLWLRVASPLAPAATVSQIAQLAETIAERDHVATVAHASAFDRLSRTVTDDTERIAQGRLEQAKALRRRIVDADHKVDVRLEKAREDFRARLDRQMQIDRESVRRLGRRDLWDKILIGSALPLFTAYGERDNPFGTNNLTLTASLLIFLAGHQVVEALFGSDAAKSPYALDDADAWSYLAPLANLLAGWWLLSDRQHQRFVTGMTTVNIRSHDANDGTVFYRGRANVDLATRIGKDHFADFVGFTDVPAVASIGGVRWSPEAAAIDPRIEGVSARVDAGILKLAVRAVPQIPAAGPPPSALGDVDLAWMVDTNEPSVPVPAK
jgi:hypothetical protein